MHVSQLKTHCPEDFLFCTFSGERECYIQPVVCGSIIGAGNNLFGGYKKQALIA